MHAASTAIRCTQLVKTYGDLIAVNGLDLEIHPGECFGLLGPNGAGKTTTVEMLEGLKQPDSGSIEILGCTWERDGERLRQSLGVQLQEAQLIEKLSVAETIRLFRSFYSRGPDVATAIGLVGLQEKAGVWVQKLSGGQKQRLSLACALVGDPDVVFLDEPTTGLDPQARRQIWELIGSLRERSRTVLLTTHYMEEAQRLCDRLAIIDHGKIIAQGTPDELIASLGAQHVVEISLSQPSTFETHRLGTLPGVRDIAEDNGKVRLTVDEVHRTLPELLTLLQRHDAELANLATHHATLEDVFVSLTGRQLRDG